MGSAESTEFVGTQNFLNIPVSVADEEQFLCAMVGIYFSETNQMIIPANVAKENFFAFKHVACGQIYWPLYFTFPVKRSPEENKDCCERPRVLAYFDKYDLHSFISQGEGPRASHYTAHVKMEPIGL